MGHFVFLFELLNIFNKDVYANGHSAVKHNTYRVMTLSGMSKRVGSELQAGSAELQEGRAVGKELLVHGFVGSTSIYMYVCVCVHAHTCVSTCLFPYTHTHTLGTVPGKCLLFLC